MDSSADYVNEVFKSRSETAAEMLAAEEAGEEYEDQDASDAIWDFPLAIDRKVFVRITIGFGGPTDWIDAVCTSDGGMLGLESATYTAAWGSDRKVTELHRSDALWKLAERYVESMEA